MAVNTLNKVYFRSVHLHQKRCFFMFINSSKKNTFLSIGGTIGGTVGGTFL